MTDDQFRSLLVNNPVAREMYQRGVERGRALGYGEGFADGQSEPVSEQPATVVAEPTSELDRATSWLRTKLADRALPARDVLADARSAGVARRTLRRAKRVLEVESVQTPDGWVWQQVARLPENGQDVRLEA
jgi:hypothetical protein